MKEHYIYHTAHLLGPFTAHAATLNLLNLPVQLAGVAPTSALFVFKE